MGLCNSICRYDTDKNGYVDHREFLAKLGGELAPGDIHGPSTLIAEQSQQVMESMYQKQQVSYNILDLFMTYKMTFKAKEMSKQQFSKVRGFFPHFDRTCTWLPRGIKPRLSPSYQRLKWNSS